MHFRSMFGLLPVTLITTLVSTANYADAAPKNPRPKPTELPIKLVEKNDPAGETLEARWAGRTRAEWIADMRSKRANTRRDALGALTKLAPNDPEVIAVVERALEDDALTRYGDEGMRGLVDLEGKPELYLEFVLEEFRRGEDQDFAPGADDELRRRCAYVFAEIGELATASLRELTTSEDASIRRFAKETLREIERRLNQSDE